MAFDQAGDHDDDRASVPSQIASSGCGRNNPAAVTDLNSTTIPGAKVSRVFDKGASAVPILDGIEEFPVITSTPDAEYGRFFGAVINVISKSC